MAQVSIQRSSMFLHLTALKSEAVVKMFNRSLIIDPMTHFGPLSPLILRPVKTPDAAMTSTSFLALSVSVDGTVRQPL